MLGQLNVQANQLHDPESAVGTEVTLFYATFIKTLIICC